MKKETCPDCGSDLKVVIGERADESYGEYLECPECGWDNGSDAD